MHSIGSKIKQLRQEKGLSLNQLATKSGVSKAYLSQLENEESTRPSAEILYKIATVLETSIAFLLGHQLEVDEEVTSEGFLPSLQKAGVGYQIPDEDMKILGAVSTRLKHRNMSPEDWFGLYVTLKKFSNS